MNNKYIITAFLLFAFNLNIGAQCIDDTHSPFKNQGWLSCDSSQSPNLERGDSHWIMYDLGHNYIIDSMTIWNHNVWGETESGAKRISIDVSNDKNRWNNVGTFDINKATGSWKYQTDNIIQLNNATGQYFLITVLENWDRNSNCSGIAEVRFGIGISTSNDNILSEENWSVYPNPALDNLTVDIEDKTKIERIQVINALGQIVSSYYNVNANLSNISLANLHEGIYYVHVLNDGKTEVKSFVKM